MELKKRYKAVFFDLGGTLRIALNDEAYMRHARRKMAEIAGTDMPYEDFYQLVEDRYEPYRKWALGENKESGDEELWCKWLLPDYDPIRIAQVCHELSFQYRQTKGRRVVVDGTFAPPPVQHVLQLGADIVIATPGRLLSHIKLGTVDLSRVSFFILDEADRMLDMGFFDDIMQVYKQLPPTCQTIMFSATMPPKIQTLAKSILKDPVEVKIAISRPPESIMQTAYICYDPQKIKILQDLFTQAPPRRVIIFSSSKMKVKELTSTLKKKKFNVAAMHSDLEQSQREEVMKAFKNGHIDILVATDVVARGIDINDIRLVVNFDIPHDPEDYVHRIGRTARGTNGEGLAITFVAPNEQPRFQKLEEFLEKEIYKIPIDPKFGEVPAYEPSKYRTVIKKQGRTLRRPKRKQA